MSILQAQNDYKRAQEIINEFKKLCTGSPCRKGTKFQVMEFGVKEYEPRGFAKILLLFDIIKPQFLTGYAGEVYRTCRNGRVVRLSFNVAGKSKKDGRRWVMIATW